MFSAILLRSLEIGHNLMRAYRENLLIYNNEIADISIFQR